MLMDGMEAKRETPPHTWRKSNEKMDKQNFCRNTSTYVEKIEHYGDREPEFGKHLHIRGENESSGFLRSPIMETPPHTWRKFSHGNDTFNRRRNTSTYVEKINF